MHPSHRRSAAGYGGGGPPLPPTGYLDPYMSRSLPAMNTATDYADYYGGGYYNTAPTAAPVSAAAVPYGHQSAAAAVYGGSYPSYSASIPAYPSTPSNYYQQQHQSRGRYYQDAYHATGSGGHRSRSLQPYSSYTAAAVPPRHINNYYSAQQPYYANYAATGTTAYTGDPYAATTNPYQQHSTAAAPATAYNTADPYAAAAAYPRNSAAVYAADGGSRREYYAAPQYDYYSRGGGAYRYPAYDYYYGGTTAAAGYGGATWGGVASTGTAAAPRMDSAYRSSGYSTLPTRSGAGYYDSVPPTRSYGQQDPYAATGYYNNAAGAGATGYYGAGRTGMGGYDRSRSYSYSDVYGGGGGQQRGSAAAAGSQRWPTTAGGYSNNHYY